MAADAVSSRNRPQRAAPTRRDVPLVTPDGRYIVVRGRLWRRANPNLSEAHRAELVADLMSARRAVGTALRDGDDAALVAARARVHEAKVGLGERGPVWWRDGAPDQNRRMVRNTAYAEWFAASAGMGADVATPGQGT